MTAGAPILVTALFGKADFARLDGLRRAHYPADRNRVPAHLTLFRHLPPSLAGELRHRLAELGRTCPPPPARIDGAIDLGEGVALRIASPALAAMRDELAEAFAGLLTPQDRAGWRPHVTIQNKVARREAKALFERIGAALEPHPLEIVGLASWHYRDGPWEKLSEHRFRG